MNKKIWHNNLKFFGIMLGVIILGVISISYAVSIASSKNVNMDVVTANMDVKITYDEGSNDDTIENSGNMLPIADDLVNGSDVSDPRVLKATFNVTGTEDNPPESIYDIALYNINADCELRTDDLKWRLYKNGEPLSEGTLSPTFDTMEGNRLVLTETQEDLSPDVTDKYTFLLWISEACTGDLSSCDPSMDQSKYLNKNFSATIKLELATKTKKDLVRVKGSEGSCEYATANVPLCNVLTYDGSEQILTNEGIGYTLINGTGKKAGSYAVTAKLDNGYKWSDGTVQDKVVKCEILKRDVTITTKNQSINYGEDISQSIDNISATGLASTDEVDTFSLSTNIVDVGSGKISASALKIINSTDDSDVTDNYNISYNNTGICTINCIEDAEEPKTEDFQFDDTIKTGVYGGKNIELSGDVSGRLAGDYTASATPIKNHCWVKGGNDTLEYTWSILSRDASLTTSVSNLTILYPNDGTFTYKYTGDGKVTCSSSSSIASCSIDTQTSTVTVKPSGVGNVTIKVSASGTSNYDAVEKSVSVIINRPQATITPSKSSVSVEYPNTATFNYNYDGDGTVSCTTANSSIATCSVNEGTKTVTVNSVASGSTSITLNASQGNVYLSTKSSNISVNVTYLQYSITLNRNQSSNDSTSLGTLYGRYSEGIYTNSTYTTKMSTTSNPISIPSWTGHTFAGYYTARTGGVQLITANGYLTSSFTTSRYSSNTTLYAHWNSPPSATLTSTSNLKATSQTASLTCSDDVGVTGYYFGTNANPSSSDFTSVNSTDTYTAQKNILVSDVNSDVGNDFKTYYLVCKNSSNLTTTSDPITFYKYTVSNMLYNGNGSMSNYNTSSYTRSDMAFNTYVAPSGTQLTPSSIYTAPGSLTYYPFMGMSESTSSTVNNTTRTLTKTTGYLAWFGRKSYTVRYDLQGGEGVTVPNQTKYYGLSLTLSTARPKKQDGTTFVGWSTEKGATSATYEPGGSYNTNADVTLYAVYSNPTLSNYITNLYIDGPWTQVVNNNITYYYHNSSGLMADQLGGTVSAAKHGNQRYYGSDPNNYIYFNCDDYSNQSSSTCDIWRIIGVFDNKVKIIYSSMVSSTGLSKIMAKSWNTSSSTDWSSSSLNSYLNTTYFNSISNLQTKLFISYSSWNIGGFNISGGTGLSADSFYKSEIELQKSGRVGLISASDYAYASDFRSCDSLLCISESNNWLSNIHGWTITPVSTSLSKVANIYLIDSKGLLTFSVVTDKYYPYPTVYLSADTIYGGGNGTKNDPYRIK